MIPKCMALSKAVMNKAVMAALSKAVMSPFREVLKGLRVPGQLKVTYPS
jgi:hypothetical protein